MRIQTTDQTTMGRMQEMKLAMRTRWRSRCIWICLGGVDNPPFPLMVVLPHIPPYPPHECFIPLA